MEEKHQWSKKETHVLINIYKQRPELWNTKAREYRDKLKKQKTYRLLAEKFNTTEREIQRKLHNLRTQHTQEVKKIKKKLDQGIEDEEFCKSSWEYFDDLQFLSNPDAVDDFQNDLMELQFEYKPLVSASIAKRASSCKLQTQPHPEEKVLPKKLQASDEHQIFGDHVAAELRSLRSDDNRRKLKRMIQRAILEISEIDDNDTGTE